MFTNEIQAVRQEISAMLGTGMLQGLGAVRALRYVENNQAEVQGYMVSMSGRDAADLVVSLSQ